MKKEDILRKKNRQTIDNQPITQTDKVDKGDIKTIIVNVKDVQDTKTNISCTTLYC